MSAAPAAPPSAAPPRQPSTIESVFALILSVFVVIFIGYQIWWSDSKALQSVDLMSSMSTDAVRPTRSAIEFPRTAPARSWSEQIAEEKPLLEFLADEKDVADLAEGGYFGAKDILERRERAEKLTQEEKDILERAGATWTSLETLRRQPRKETGPGAAVE